MGLFMPSDPLWLQPLQRTQRSLAMGVHRLDPCEVLARDTWGLAADHLTRRWFPRSVDLAIAELIQTCYLHALWWFPILQQRCHGTYRPTWHRGTLLTWFRRSASMATQQWFYAPYRIEPEATFEAAVAQASALPGAGDPEWVEESLRFLADLAATGSLKSRIAQYLLETLAFLDNDRAFEVSLGYRARPSERRVLRAAKRGTASYLRYGRDIHVLCDAHRAARSEEGAIWTDLREGAVPVLDYVIRALPGGEKGAWRLAVELQSGVLAEARASIKAIVTGPQKAQFRLQQLRRFLYAFEATHRYAPGARHQFIELSKYAASQSKRHLKAQLGSGTDSTIPRIRVTNTLIIPRPNPFLEPAPLEEWERWFSPRR